MPKNGHLCIMGAFLNQSNMIQEQEMAQQYMLVCQIMTPAIDTKPKARL
ncbi:MAG: hypothetical protein IJ242_06000 [Clostridia bacterium]|nr:hypothetical protein [Clostridia bacterium]